MVPGPLSRAVAAGRRRWRRLPDATLAALALAGLAGAVTLLLTTQLYPYHTPNHDEGVYLQQAAMLLEGRLVLQPPVPEAMRPWFFVADGGRLYPKYGPVPAAVFALGEAGLGSYRAALGAVAVASVWLTYRLGTAAADGSTGLAAAGLLAVAPLFLVQSAVFLPYATTFALELTFALGYVRAVRRSSIRWGALAGTAIGLAFFARPWTAILFASPFVLHAGWALLAHEGNRRPLAPLLAVAGVGAVLVGVTLAYNSVLTGAPLRFPYEAFAPRDGLGFGERAILGYERTYTPALATRATAANLALFATTWAPAGVVGVGLAIVGAVVGLRPTSTSPARSAATRSALTDRQLRLVLVGLIPAIVVGNAYFWGILNVLGDLDRAGDGLVQLLGPYYHFDLLLPVALFGGLELVALHRWTLEAVAPGRSTVSVERRAAVLAVVLAVVVTAASGAVAARPLADATATTENYEAAYAPVEGRDLDEAVVLLPTPYGDWLNHPFQVLRNDPGYDEGPVYAIDDGPMSLEVLAAFPARTPYRYVYRGTWAPQRGAAVESRLQPLERASGEAVVLRLDFGVPDGITRGSLRLAGRDDAAYAAVDPGAGRVSLALRLTPGTAALSGGAVEPTGDGRIDLAGRDEVTLEVFLEGEGTDFSYRLALPIVTDETQVETVTPTIEVCRWPRRCGGEAAYLPNRSAAGVDVEVALETTAASA